MDKDLNFIQPAVSIIIPVYNVEKYVKRCLDSVFNQQFSKSIEVIAVDDFSTDLETIEILKKYNHQIKLNYRTF